MRRIAIVLAVLLLAGLTVGDALAIQNSQGLVSLKFAYGFKIDGEGKAKGKAEGEGLDLRVNFDTVELEGGLGLLLKPTMRTIDTDFAFRIPILAEQATQTRVKTKIPALADIPLLGTTFKTKSETEEFLSLLIIVNPMIIDDVEKSDAEPLVLGGGVDLETYKAAGKVSIHKKFTFYKGKMKLKLSGTITDGPHAGKAMKGSVKLSFSGGRVF